MYKKYKTLKHLLVMLAQIPRIVEKLDAQTDAIADAASRISQLSDRVDHYSQRSESNAEFDRLDRAGRLIKLDYPYNPRRRPWDPATSTIFALLDQSSARYAALLNRIADLSGRLEQIPMDAAGNSGAGPNWSNGWFPALDAISLYGMLALNNPRHYVEIGSGNSTLFARQAIRDHGLRTKIISIDPHPREDIDRVCDQVIRAPCEDVVGEINALLSAEDIFFVDNSHRSFPNSDVTVFFSEILPNLKAGVIYGLHDIMLPWDYPDEWRDRFYNEQYLLEAYLLGGARQDEILLANCFVSYHAPHLSGSLFGRLEAAGLTGLEKTGTAFWMKRAA